MSTKGWNPYIASVGMTRNQLIKEIKDFFQCFPDTVIGTPDYSTLRNLRTITLLEIYSQALVLANSLVQDPINPEGTTETSEDISEDPTQP